MRTRPSFRPRLDTLEDRVCPSLTLQTVGPDLAIRGTPATSLSGLTITGVGGANFDVMDGVKDLGTYTIDRNLTLDLRHYNSPITLNLNGQALPGNITFDFGAGNVFSASRPISIISTAQGGTIGGSVKLVGGSGDETLNIGGPGGLFPVSVLGNVTFSGRNGHGENNNTLAIFDGTSVGGNVTASLVSNILIGQSGGAGAFIGNNLSVYDAGARSEMALSINQGSLVAGRVWVIGTSQFNQRGDRFIVESGAAVNGKLTANLGSKANLWQLGGTFNSSVLLYGGGGPQPNGGSALNTIELDNGAGSLGKFNGSVTAIIGGGSTAFVFNAGTVITGNLNLAFGNGTHDLGGGSLGGVFAGSVNGNITISLGSGLNTGVIDTAPGRSLLWNSGAGVTNLTLGSAQAPANTFWRVNLHFGVGTNTLTLDPTAPPWQFLKGYVTGRNATDSFVNSGLDWSLTTNFVLGRSF
jgi:hypothetical protein